MRPLSVPDKDPAGGAPGGVPAPDEVGVGSADGVVFPVDADGEVGVAEWAGGGLAPGAAPVAPGCAAPRPRATSGGARTASTAGRSSLVYRWLRETPKERCGFNKYQ